MMSTNYRGEKVSAQGSNTYVRFEIVFYVDPFLDVNTWRTVT